MILEIIPELRVQRLRGHLPQDIAVADARHTHLDKSGTAAFIFSIVMLLLNDSGSLVDNLSRQVLAEDLYDCLIAAEARDVDRVVLIGVEDLGCAALQQLIGDFCVSVVGSPVQRGHPKQGRAKAGE